MARTSLGPGLVTPETLKVVESRYDNNYHAQFDQSPAADNDCLLYVENTDSLRNLVIVGIWLQVDGASEIYLQLNDTGTRNSASSITPVNLDARSAESANGNFEQGTDLGGGVATLSGGTEVERYVFSAANSSTPFETNITLGKNDTLTLWCSLSTVTVHGTVVVYYE